MTERTPDGSTLKSVDTAMEVIEALSELEAAGVTEIADAVGRSKSTVHHYVKTLEHRDYLENDDGTYRLSLQFLALGGQVRERQALYRHGKSDVDRLAERTGEVARLVVEHDGKGLTLYQAAGEEVSSPITHVGTVEPLHCMAAGKAFLAELPPDERERYLSEMPLKANTPHTVTDVDTLCAEIEDVAESGVAFDDEECYDSVRCVAAAVKTAEDDLLGAISVSAPVSRLGDDRFREDIPDTLRNVAGVVEINTTYSNWESSVIN
jgi:DNA-binding IclR family transcriptional regulator